MIQFGLSTLLFDAFHRSHLRNCLFQDFFTFLRYFAMAYYSYSLLKLLHASLFSTSSDCPQLPSTQWDGRLLLVMPYTKHPGCMCEPSSPVLPLSPFFRVKSKGELTVLIYECVIGQESQPGRVVQLIERITRLSGSGYNSFASLHFTSKSNFRATVCIAPHVLYRCRYDKVECGRNCEHQLILRSR